MGCCNSYETIKDEVYTFKQSDGCKCEVHLADLESYKNGKYSEAMMENLENGDLIFINTSSMNIAELAELNRWPISLYYQEKIIELTNNVIPAGIAGIAFPFDYWTNSPIKLQVTVNLTSSMKSDIINNFKENIAYNERVVLGKQYISWFFDENNNKFYMEFESYSSANSVMKHKYHHLDSIINEGIYSISREGYLYGKLL